MYIVNTSARAFVAALAPLAVLHAVLFSLGLAGYLAPTGAEAVAFPSPDQVFLLYVRRLALDASLLYVGHMGARRRGIGSRLAYALIGGAAAALGYFFSIRLGIWVERPPEGTFITAGILPTLVGMISGFLYSQLAGREAIAWPTEDEAADGVPTSWVPSFEGPVQVRTSMAAIAVASLVPGLLVGVITLPFGFYIVNDMNGWRWPSDMDWRGDILALALPAQFLLTALFVSVIPSAIFLLAVHGLARAFSRTRGLDYAVLGAVVGVLFMAVLFPLTPFKNFPFFAIPSAVMGAMMATLYRRFAGLQPRPLPEPVLVSDVDALVPEDDPTRKRHAIVING